MAHRVTTLDAQPSNETGGIMVLVTGALLVCLSYTGREEYPADMSTIGRRRTEAHELHPGVPTPTRIRQLLCIQRRLQTHLWLVEETFAGAVQ